MRVSLGLGLTEIGIGVEDEVGLWLGPVLGFGLRLLLGWASNSNFNFNLNFSPNLNLGLQPYLTPPNSNPKPSYYLKVVLRIDKI